jgi:PEP-CTERM/exosortase A-associated glycosyltransferase
MTRVLHVLDHSLPLHSGYCFRTRAILKAQIAAGLQVAAVTGVRQDQSGYQATAPLERFDDLDFYRTLTDVGGPSPLREMREVSVLADRIVDVCRTWRPDILHAHSPALNGLAALKAARRLGLSLVYEIRAFWEDAAVGNGTGREGSAKYWLTRQLENHVVAASDAVVVICEGLKNDLVARGVSPEKISLSPNGVDLQMFGQPPAYDDALGETLKLAGKTVLGFIGSFYDYEGLDTLVSAMQILHSRNSDIRLLLVGGGPVEVELKKQIADAGLNDIVQMTGRVPHDQVERYYSLMDIMVYPRKAMRLTELVTPLKPLEAMAQGKINVASSVGGHRELIVDNQTGFLFAPDDPNALARSVEMAIARREDWPDIRQTARQFVETERNWAANILRYLPIYQVLITRGISRQAA